MGRVKGRTLDNVRARINDSVVVSSEELGKGVRDPGGHWGILV